ncbi:Lipase [Lachnellula subtilissima]|uniref:Lipase n=1 Tax=Lachnellula subtilissima TaxID=602034 RepID=A0A8H8UGV4_9HELO|nr:Lipase [Lachnellula subtilissima]
MKLSVQYALLLCLGLVTVAPIEERDGRTKGFMFRREWRLPFSGIGPDLDHIILHIGKHPDYRFCFTGQHQQVDRCLYSRNGEQKDMQTDLDFPRVKTSMCGTANPNDGCEIHQGFWKALLDVQVDVKASVVNALKSHPNYKVVATGHSLGGAVGALVGAMLRTAGINTDIYTYGQPKLGTADISNYIQNQAPAKGSNYRVTHYNDLIPSLPPHLDDAYPEFYINTADGDSIQTGDVDQVNGREYEMDGNEQAVATTEGLALLVTEIVANADALLAHFDYFGKISACSSDAPGS